MSGTFRSTPALVIIDVQKGFHEIEARGGRRNNPDAVANMARLLGAFREQELPIFHIRHASTEADSVFRPERLGHASMDETREAGDEPVIVKNVNSSFIGTDLEQRLRTAGIESLVICGATTNHCVETTTRMAGNLGFDAHLVADACFAFARTGYGGRAESAEDIHAMSLSNLDGEFATIQTTDSVLAALPRREAA